MLTVIILSIVVLSIVMLSFIILSVIKVVAILSIIYAECHTFIVMLRTAFIFMLSVMPFITMLT